MALPVNMMTGMEAMNIAANVGTQATQRGLIAAQTQSTRADTANKYAEFRQKTQEIAARDLEIEELEAQQEGKLAGADVFNQRNLNMLENVEGIKKADKGKIAVDAMTPYVQLQDQQRQQTAAFADSVVDEHSHNRAYQELNALAQTQDSTAEEMFGIGQQYQGKRSLDDWQFNKNAALATQEFMQGERMEAVKYKRTRERDDFLKESDIEKQFIGFQHDVILQDMRNQAAIQAAAIKAKKGRDLKRSDVQDLSPKQVSMQLGTFLSGVSDFDIGDDSDATKIGEAMNEYTIQIGKEVDASWIEYIGGRRPEPLTQGDAMIRATSQIQGRVGTDGEFHNTGSSKLERQKKEWQAAWITDAIKINERFAALPEDAMNAYAETAWSNPEARKERE